MKTVLVTGASGGLGGTVVETLAAAGWSVLAADRTARTPAGSNVKPVAMDVTSTASIQQALAGQAPVDALVHCAGGFRFGAATQVTDEDVDLLLGLNLKSAILLARALLPGMQQRNKGSLVFVGAAGALSPKSGMATYAASKAGLHAFTVALADEVRPTNITVNAILPSTIDTPQNRSAMPQANTAAWVTPQQLAGVVKMLLSPDGAAFHGALLPVTHRA
jgi:NAD(P)-dependent dehydrogenase (short-subunit alcohol dehydrogenase family)